MRASASILTLQVGAVTETVEVTGAAAALETDSSEHGQVINTQQVVELPLNGRNYADLALLSTNVVKSPIAVSFSPSGTPREGAFNVNGMRSTYNNFLLDGAGQQRLRHQQPGIFVAGGAAVAGRDRRIQSDHHATTAPSTGAWAARW